MNFSSYAQDQQHRIASRGMGRAGFITPYLKPGMSLLDVGCGPGSITMELAKVVAPGRVLGVDIDEAAIEQARKAVVDKGVENISFELGDAAALRIPDNSFDAACAASTFQWLQRPVESAREILRVLRPGGVFAARDRARDGDQFGNLTPVLDEALDVYDRISRYRGANHRFGSRLYSTFLQAGFADVATAGSYDEAGRSPVYFYSPFNDPDQARIIVQQGWAEEQKLAEYTAAWKSWSQEPESFMLIARCEAVGWKAVITRPP
jgi:ubiquinone/menaquinone biosynthesis C-methylase UbiE